MIFCKNFLIWPVKFLSSQKRTSDHFNNIYTFLVAKSRFLASSSYTACLCWTGLPCVKHCDSDSLQITKGPLEFPLKETSDKWLKWNRALCSSSAHHNSAKWTIATQVTPEIANANFWKKYFLFSSVCSRFLFFPMIIGLKEPNCC